MKQLLFFLSAVVIAGGIYGIYLYNKKPLDTHDQNADFDVSATVLVQEFLNNEEAAAKKYVDKLLIVTGPIKEINMEASTLFLDASDPSATVTCSFYTSENEHLKKLKPGDWVSVKGKCTGKLIDIVMNNCILTNSQ